MTALRAGDLSELLARKGEALPAARRKGPASWLDEDGGISGYADTDQRHGDAPLEDSMIAPTDLVNLITPVRRRSMRLLSTPQVDCVKADRPRKLFGGESSGAPRFQQAVGEEAETQPMRSRRQMTVRLSIEAFGRLKAHVDAEDITYQKALSDAVSDYLERVAE